MALRLVSDAGGAKYPSRGLLRPWPVAIVNGQYAT